MADRARYGSKLAVLLAVIAGIGLVWWLLRDYELREQEFLDWSPQAERNRFLVAGLLLEAAGHETTTDRARRLVRELPAVGDTLVVERVGSSMNEQGRQRLLEWVGAGGHLITTPSRAWNADDDTSGDPIMDLLGVRYREPVIDFERFADTVSDPGSPIGTDADETAPLADNSPKVRGPIYKHVVSSLIGDDLDPPVDLDFRTFAYLEDGAGLAVGGLPAPRGYDMLRYSMGEGKLTVLSSNTFMLNEVIGEGDNGWLLLNLIGPSGAGIVHLGVDVPVPWLLPLIMQNAPEALVAAALLGLMIIWRLMIRFGPPVPDPAPLRRDLMEHFDAIGGYRWRTGGAPAYLRETRERLLHAWRRRNPELCGLGDETAMLAVSHITGTDDARVGRLYADPEERGGGVNSFVGCTRILQSMTPRSGRGTSR